MNIKKSLLLMTVIAALVSCKDITNLDVENPNEPTPAVANSEEGMIRIGRGIYESFDLDAPANFYWNVQVYHETMGDAIVTPWGNYQYRWMAQVSSVRLADGTVIPPPQGGTQPEEVVRVNTRQLGSDQSITQEWNSMYYLNNAANLILSIIDNAQLSGDSDGKKNGYRAWAHFWKGYAYSRIGSMYESGLILDEYGVTKGDYKTRQEIIAEANAQFAKFRTLASNFDLIASDVVPSLMIAVPTSTSLVQASYTLEARNLLVNKATVSGVPGMEQMTQADWTAIRDLTENGLVNDDNTALVARTDNTTWPGGTWFIWQAAYGGYGWHNPSERIFDDFQPDDNRLNNFVQTSTWNTRGRGVAYNTRYRTDDTYATLDATEDYVRWYYVSAAENKLMRAEALMNLDQLAQAAALIDQVRAMQDAGLPPVDGSSRASVEAQLISERRVGLFLRGLSYYDARRWGWSSKRLANGGGRTGVTVVMNDNTVQANASIDYNFMPYWPIPDGELTFNPPTGGGSAGSTK